MDNPIAFLRARYDEEERVARAAAKDGERWRPGSEGEIYPSDEARHPGPIIIGPWGGLDDEHQAHIVRWDPGRVLAEVGAKRAILDLHQTAGLLSAPNACATCAAHPGPCDTLRLLAQPYAGHPDYREEWWT